MNPLTIKPITLKEAKRTVQEGYRDDCALAVNRMIAIATSPIDSYFYGFKESMLELAGVLDIDPCKLSRMSFGEVACMLGCGISDTTLERQHIKASSAKATNSEAGDSRELSTQPINPYEQIRHHRMRSAMLAFMKPLEHLARAIHNEEAYLPLEQCKKPQFDPPDKPGDSILELLEARWSSRAKPSLPKNKQLESFLEEGFVAKQRVNQEFKLSNTFPLSGFNYDEALEYIQPSVADKAYRAFPIAQLNLYSAITEIVSQCKKQSIQKNNSSPDGLNEDEQIPPSPPARYNAFDALYRLFIRPYACIYVSQSGRSYRT